MQSTDTCTGSPKTDCDECGASFERWRRGMRFCSEKCARAYHNRQTALRRPPKPPLVRPEKSCIECSVVFRPTNRSGPTPSCCSEACQHAREYRSQKKKPRPVVSVTCVTCGVSFTASIRRVRFCSGQCQSISNGHRVSLKCDHCGVDFTRNKDAVRGEDNNFCSSKCHQGFKQRNARRSRQASCEQCEKAFKSCEKNGHWDRCCSRECSNLLRGDKSFTKSLAGWFFEWHSDAPCERDCRVCGCTFSCQNGDWRAKCESGCKKSERCKCFFCGSIFPSASSDRDSCDSCLSALSAIVADAKARKMAVRNAWLLSGYKPCQGCGEEIPVKCFGDTNKVFCSSCKGLRQREKGRTAKKGKSKRRWKKKKDSPMRAIYDQWISLGSKPCSKCQAGFPVSTFQDCNRLYCQACKGDVDRERSRLKGKKNGHSRRRARKFNVPYENVDRLSVFQRDEYKCWICGKKTLSDFALSEGSSCPHPDSPTLDHVIPLSKGGPHSYSNTKCACFLCNCLKSDKIDFVKCPQGHTPQTGGQC